MIEIDLKIKHYMPTPGNGVYMKQMHLPAGHEATSHKHNYFHYSLLAKGVMDGEVDGAIERHEGPCVINIDAGKTHKFYAITDCDVFCIHATDESDPDRIDETLIKGE